jgi:hypothetical protein
VIISAVTATTYCLDTRAHSTTLCFSANRRSAFSASHTYSIKYASSTSTQAMEKLWHRVSIYVSRRFVPALNCPTSKPHVSSLPWLKSDSASRWSDWLLFFVSQQPSFIRATCLVGTLTCMMNFSTWNCKSIFCIYYFCSCSLIRQSRQKGLGPWDVSFWLNHFTALHHIP